MGNRLTYHRFHGTSTTATINTAEEAEQQPQKAVDVKMDGEILKFSATSNKTIKVVLTQKQLRDLLVSNNISFTTTPLLVPKIKIIGSSTADANFPLPKPKGWLPVLRSVPVENEFR